MDETTLIFRHLPAELSKDERKDLLLHFGASRVRIMGLKGHMKNTAFATFPSKSHATEVMHQLHQATLLGSKLVVEFSRSSKENPFVTDGEALKQSSEKNQQLSDECREDQQKTAQKEIKFDDDYATWGLKHPRRPELKYRYPPPNPTILTNIANALAALPKFYVQVLHLMNKMDLPSPFGHMTQAPPMMMPQQEDIADIEMKISDSEESQSELESDEDGKTDRKQDAAYQLRQLKRRQKMLMKRIMAPPKKPRLSEFHLPATSIELHSLTDPLSAPQPPSTPAVPIKDVFDHMTQSQAPKKIALKISQTPAVLQQKQQSDVIPHKTLSSSFSPLPPPPSIPPPPLPSFPSFPQSQTPQQRSSNFPLNSALPSNNNNTNNSTPSSMQASLPSLQHPPHHPPLQQHLHQHPHDYQQQQHQHLHHHHHETHTATRQPERYSPSKNDKNGDDANESSDHLHRHVEGFGTIPHIAKPHQDTPKDTTQETEDPEVSGKKKFISSSALRRGRITASEMKDTSVFRRYDPGEVSCRLYIKNVAKQATYQDLHFIFGRYVDWESQVDTNMFDIRLMKEGRMKGQAFVTLPSEEVAKDAVSETNGFLLKEKPLVVQFARSAKAQEDAAAVKE